VREHVPDAVWRARERFKRAVRGARSGSGDPFEAPVDREKLPLDFDPETLPWLDRQVSRVDGYLARTNGGEDRGSELREKLLHYAQFGYVTFPGLIDHRLIDAYLADVEELFEQRKLSTPVMIEGYGTRPVHECQPSELETPHMRVMDFHSVSVAGKKMALHPQIVSFLGHVFRDTVVAMQTLTFMHGTEQTMHQDYAYVVPPRIPSHLAATWIALEDSHPDSGPLAYYPGSHTIRKFDWGNGLFFTPESTADEADFERHILTECRRMGLKEEVFLAKKGDVFFWHGALAHGGSPARDSARTRKSFVTHYSSRTAYPRDRRDPAATPDEHTYNGGVVYGDPVRPQDEDALTRGRDI
jgi:phytanoyl-CoA hydroxylase